MALYRTCPSDGVVVCFDEFGPISLQPYPGHCYAQPTPTSASHLNRIEGHFRPLREFVLNASGYTSHAEVAA